MPSTESRWYIDGLSGPAVPLLDKKLGLTSELVFFKGESVLMWPCNEKEMNDILTLCCKLSIPAKFYERGAEGALELRDSLPFESSPKLSRTEFGKGLNLTSKHDGEQLSLIAG